MRSTCVSQGSYTLDREAHCICCLHSVFLQHAPIPWLCPYLHFICLAGVESAISYPFTLFLIHLPHDSVYLSPSCLHLWLSAQLFLSLLHPPQDFSSLTAWLSVSFGVLAKAKCHKLTGFEWCKYVLFSSGDQDFETDIMVFHLCDQNPTALLGNPVKSYGVAGYVSLVARVIDSQGKDS